MLCHHPHLVAGVPKTATSISPDGARSASYSHHPVPTDRDIVNKVRKNLAIFAIPTESEQNTHRVFTLAALLAATEQQIHVNLLAGDFPPLLVNTRRSGPSSGHEVR